MASINVGESDLNRIITFGATSWSSKKCVLKYKLFCRIRYSELFLFIKKSVSQSETDFIFFIRNYS